MILCYMFATRTLQTLSFINCRKALLEPPRDAVLLFVGNITLNKLLEKEKYKWCFVSSGLDT